MAKPRSRRAGKPKTWTAHRDAVRIVPLHYPKPGYTIDQLATAQSATGSNDLYDGKLHFAPANAQLNGASGGNGGILLGTELGVWTTSQINGTSTQWIPNNTGLANVSTFMLRYRASDNLVVAATYGRGLFTTILPTVVTGVPDNTITKDFIKYISADNNKLQIVIGGLQTRAMTIQLLDMSGRLVDSRQNRYQNSVIDINKLQSGVYIVKIIGDKKENFIQQFVKR